MNRKTSTLSVADLLDLMLVAMVVTGFGFGAQFPTWLWVTAFAPTIFSVLGFCILVLGATRTILRNALREPEQTLEEEE